MEEKREIKVRLSTVIYLFIIFILIIALGVVYYLGFLKNNNEKEKTENEVSNINTIQKDEKDEIENISTTQKDEKDEIENIKKDENIINKTILYNPENAKYKEITESTFKENEGLYITNIESINGKYEIKGIKFEEYTITENEFNKLKRGAKIIIEGNEFYYTNKEKYYSDCLISNYEPNILLAIMKRENGIYALEGTTEYNITRKMTNDYFKIIVDDNTKYIEYDAIWNEEKGYAENKEISIEDIANKFIYVEPKDVTHPTGLYRFVFNENGDVSISYLPTGH